MPDLIQYLTIFQPDGITTIDGVVIAAGAMPTAVQTTCSTDPSHTRPHLMQIDQAPDRRVELVEGKAAIGAISIRLQDTRRLASQATGWFTKLLSDWQGLKGHRFFVQQQDRWSGGLYTIFDGLLQDADLEDSKTVYRLGLRDIRERERNLPLFLRAENTVVWPYGNLEKNGVAGVGTTTGYGRLDPQNPTSKQLIPPSKGVKAYYDPLLNQASPINAGFGGAIMPDPNVLTGQFTFADKPWLKSMDGNMPYEAADSWQALVARYNTPTEPYPAHENVIVTGLGSRTVGETRSGFSVRWRPWGSTGAWTTLRYMPVWYVKNTAGFDIAVVPYFGGNAWRGKDGRGENQLQYVAVTAVNAADLPPSAGYYEVQVLSGLPPDEQAPFFFEGTFGQLLKNCYDGLYSNGLTSVKYDQAVMADLVANTPIARLIKTEIELDGRAWLQEHWYKVMGMFPRINAVGEIVPTSYELPDVSVSLTTLDDNNLEEASWSHPVTNAVTAVDFMYHRDYVAQNNQLMSQDVQLSRLSAPGMTQIGNKLVTFAPETVRDVSGAREPQYGLAPYANEVGYYLGTKRQTQLVTRFGLGGQLLQAIAMRSDAAVRALVEGSWVVVAASWLPDYQTGLRGMSRLMQVTGIKDHKVVTRELELVDAGPYGQPLAAHLAGDVTVSVVSDRLKVVVQNALADTFTVVEAATGAVAPPANSAKWMVVDRRLGPGTITAWGQGLASGTTWVRVRREKVGSRPSAYTLPVSVVIPVSLAVLNPQLQVLANGTMQLTWTPNDEVPGLAVYQDIVEPNGPVDDPLPLLFELDGSLGTYNLGYLPPTFTAYTEIQGFPGFDGTHVTGTGGRRFRLNDLMYGDEDVRLSDFRYTDSADGQQRTYTWKLGAGVDAVWIYDNLHGTPTTGDPWPTSADAPTKILRKTDTQTYTTDLPKSGFERFLQFEPRLKEGGIGTIRRAIIQPRTPMLSGAITPTVTNDKVTLALKVEGAPSVFPVQVRLFEDSPDSVALVDTTILSSGELTSATYPVLANRDLPLREVRRWWLQLIDVAGLISWWPAMADRDALAAGSVAADDFQANPKLAITYDDDTDAVKVVCPDGKVKTWTGLVGSNVLEYEVGVTARDDASVETALRIDERRTSYSVQAQGGGVWTELFRGSLSGRPSKPPVGLPRLTPNLDRSNMSIVVTVDSPIGENIRLHFRDVDSPSAVTWSAVVANGDSTPLFIAPGTDFTAATWLYNGTSYGQKMNAIPLKRDQLLRVYVQLEGEQSGLRSDWLPVSLSLKEQPFLESVAFAWDQAAGKVRATVKAGTHTASIKAELDDDKNFGSPVTSLADLAEGGTATIEWVLSGANRGKQWFVKVTAYNMISQLGQASVPLVGECFVPADFGITSEVTETEGSGTLTLTVADPGGVLDPANRVKAYIRQGTGPRILTAPTTAPAGGATTGQYTFVVTLTAHNTVIEPVIYMADGTIRVDQAFTFDQNKVPDIHADVAYSLSNATVTATLDTDAAVGAGNFEFSLDGGAWSPLAVPADRVVQFGVAMSTTALQVLKMRAKNAAGAYGPEVTVQISRFATPSLGPSLSVYATAGTNSTTVTYTYDGVLTYRENGTIVTAPASPFVKNRPAEGAAEIQLSFVVVKDGLTASESVTITPIGQDTITPDVQLIPGSMTETTQNFTAQAINPRTGGHINCTVYLDGCSGTVGGTAVASGGSKTGVSPMAVVVNRPLRGSPPGNVRNRAVVNGTAEAARTVSEQTKDFTPPIFDVAVTINTGDYTFNWQEYVGYVYDYRENAGAWTTIPAGGVKQVLRALYGGNGKQVQLRATYNGIETIRSFVVDAQLTPVTPVYPPTVISRVWVSSIDYTTDYVTVSFEASGTLNSGDYFQLRRYVSTTNELDVSGSTDQNSGNSSPIVDTDTSHGYNLTSTTGPKVYFFYQVVQRNSSGVIMSSSDWFIKSVNRV